MKKRRNSRKVLTVDSIALIKMDIMKSIPMTVIAKKYDTNPTTVRNIKIGKYYKEVLVDGFIPNTKKKTQGRLTEDDIREIRKRYDDGEKISNIMDDFRIGFKHLYQIIDGEVAGYVQ